MSPEKSCGTCKHLGTVVIDDPAREINAYGFGCEHWDGRPPIKNRAVHLMMSPFRATCDNWEQGPLIKVNTEDEVMICGNCNWCVVTKFSGLASTYQCDHPSMFTEFVQRNHSCKWWTIVQPKGET